MSQFHYDLSFAKRFSNVSSAGLALPALTFGLGARALLSPQRTTDARPAVASPMAADQSNQVHGEAPRPPAMAGIPSDQQEVSAPLSERGEIPAIPQLA